MSNPFETLDNRLSRIERLLLDLKQGPLPGELDANSEKLLNIQEAAKFLNLAVPTIYSKVNRREIPFIKRSKKLYFSKEELTDYLKKGRVKTNEELLSEAHTFIKRKKGGAGC